MEVGSPSLGLGTASQASQVWIQHVQVMAFKAGQVPDTVLGAQGLRCEGDRLGSLQGSEPCREGSAGQWEDLQL